MDDLLTLDGPAKRDTAIDAWLMERVPDLGLIAGEWFAAMRGCGGDVVELMHDGCPVACVENAPFGYVNVFKSHVNVGFFRGASLKDPARILEGNGKYMRHVKLRPGVSIDKVSLQALVTAAYLDIKERLKKRRG